MNPIKLDNANLFVAGKTDMPLLRLPYASGGDVREVWRWGSDNLLPVALAMLARSSTIHRRILNDKADYVTGSGLSIDPAQKRTSRLLTLANGLEQSLRTVIQRVALDRCTFGNAFLEVVTDERRSFLAFYHQDATKCRIARPNDRVVMHHDWTQFRKKEAVGLPLFPAFEKQKDGTLRSVIHYKEYEPMFENYGLPKYIAGLGALAVAFKTDRWNISRLDNAFQPSGVMVLDGDVESQAEAAEIARMAEERFAGKPGQVMFLIKNSAAEDTTKFVPMNAATTDSDWRSLRDQSVSDTIIAHSWFRTLSGLEYATGFSADRVRHEYSIALNTLICVEQQEIIEPIRTAIEDILGENPASLAFINKPPFE